MIFPLNNRNFFFFENCYIYRLNQYIFVVGGFDGTRQLASVERYDTENQVWDSVAPIKIARSALSLTVLDGKLYGILTIKAIIISKPINKLK